MPGFERGAQLELNIALFQIANARISEFKVRREPVEFKRITGLAQIPDHILEIRLAKMWQHPAVVDIRSPADQAVFVRLLPKFRDETAQQQVLRETHSGVRRHFKRAHLD